MKRSLLFFLLALVAPAQTLEDAQALDRQGELLSLSGHPSALAVLDQALQIKSSLLPPHHPDLAQTQLVRAAELTLRRQHRQALEILQQTVAPPALQPKLFLALGITLTTVGKYKEAATTLDQALALNGNNQRDILRAQSSLAYLQSNLDLAEQLLLRAQPPPPADPLEAAQQLYQSASLTMERGRYDEAAPGLRQSLTFFETHFGPTNRRIIPILRNIARCHRFQALYQAAITTTEKALAISIQAHGEFSPPSADLLSILAISKAESGQLPEARDLYDRALAINTKLLGPNHPQVSVELFSLANLEQVMGDFPSALRNAAKALTIRESLEGKQTARTVTIYALLGRVNALNGNLSSGRQLAELAVAIARRTVGDAHPRTVYAVSDLGEVLYLAKDYPAARRHFAEALAGQAKLFGTESIRTAQSSYNLGLVEGALGHHAEALRHFSIATDIWQKAFGPDYIFLAETTAGQAASLVALRRGREALRPALEAARVRRVSLAAVTMSATEREALLFARVDRDGLLLSIDLLASDTLPPNAANLIWDAVIRDRAAILDALARRRQAAQTPGPLPRQIAQLKKELARAALVGDPKIYASRVSTLRQDLDRAERQLAQLIAAPAPTPLGLAEVRKALPPASALLGYAKGESQYVAFLSPARAIPLGPIARIDALVAAWQSEIERERTSAGRNARRNEASYRAAGLALRQAIWDPIQRALPPNARTVYLAPDGALQLVNLDTLPVGATQYLAETGPLFQTLSAERDLVARPLPPAPRTGRLLALANPPAPVSTGCEALDPRRFPSLPGAAAEAQAIAQLWNARGGSSQVLTGPAASEAALRARAPDQSVIHLATHGFFLADKCQQAREALLAGNPLLRSGLVLANSFLTAEQVSGLPLQGTELVVLSGCDTARGTFEAGEGLLGLRRAFQAAGARQVVSSLWPVDDQTTQTWMTNFYQAKLENGNTIPKAVRTASLAELRARRQINRSTHPFYWGGFLAAGR